MEIIKPGRYFDFMGQRKFWIPLSTILVILSIASLFYPGIQWGTDFKGGTEVEIAFNKDLTANELRETITKLGFGQPDVVKIQSDARPNWFLLRVQEVTALDDKQREGLMDALCYMAPGGGEPPADRCPPEKRPTEIKFSPGGDKITLRYDQEPDLDFIATRVPTVEGVQLRLLGRNPRFISESENRVEVSFKAVPDDAAREALKEALCYPTQGKELSVDACPPEKRPTELSFLSGGEKMELKYASRPSLSAIAKAMKGVAGVQLNDADLNPKIVSERDRKVEVLLKSKGDQLMDGLRKALGPNVVPDAPLREEWVGPKAGRLLRDAAIKSVGIAMIFIMVYIAFRFDARFAPGAILALIHDVFVILLVWTLARKEFSLSTVAALLTVVGYSVADTVVVYDRIRENLGKHRGKSFSDLINLSVSEMLARTILTSLTTILSLTAFLFLGMGAIKDFSLALWVGVITGTYSSVFVAAPLTEWLDRKVFASLMAKPKRTGPVRKHGEAVV
jgi:preprotein translocase subunit SecF